jgi:hypothetical protein
MSKIKLSEEHLSEKYSYGQKMIRRRSMSGKQDIGYIVCRDAGYEYLIKMAYSLPYNFGDKHFFVNLSDLIKKWRHDKEMIQLKIF